MTHKMTDEEYDDWLRGVEEAAAAKEEVYSPLPTTSYGRQRVQAVISNHKLWNTPNPEAFIRAFLEHYRFDLSAPIHRAPVTDQDAIMFYGYMKEEDHDNDNELADELVRAYLLRYGDFNDPSKVGGTLSRRDLYEMLTRSGMLGTDTFPRPDNYKFYAWSPDEASDYRRSAGKD
jgi:hypothetical protein